MVQRFVELAAPGVRGLHPYQPGKPISELECEYGVSNIIKLASNENPLGPGPRALRAIGEALPGLALYPDGSGFDLKRALAERHDVAPEAITLGNGSNDVLVLIAEAFLTPEHEAIYSQYSFAVYALAVQAVGARARVSEALGLDSPDPYGHDLAAMKGLLSKRTRVVFVANPNNPTGTWVPAGELRSLIESVPEETLVVVDEAYFDYVDEPDYPDTTQWVRDYPHLIVTRTFSKAFGLAGLRAGYSISHPEVADVLNRVRQPFNMNALALVAAEAALGDHEHISESCRINAEQGEFLAQACEELGLGYVPSVGNFLLVDMGREALPVYEALLRQAVIVRPVGNYGLPNHLRMTIGTPDGTRRLISALGQVLAPGG